MKVTELQTYKLSLALPLVVSAAFLPLLFTDIDVLPKWLATGIALTAYSGLVGGIPYVVLVALLLLWGRRRPKKQFRRALIISPLLMLLTFSLFIVIVVIIFDKGSLGWQTIEGLLFYLPWILGYGYGYVVLVSAGVFIGRRLGLISSSN